MSTTSSDTSMLDGYQLRLPNYEGPLDVLLRLIERNRLAVTDVSLVAVTDQFIEYIASQDAVSAEILADFTATAARLLVLKSRSLLPRPPRPDDDPETAEDLTRQLLAYQAIKQTALHLREREQSYVRSWHREVPEQQDLPVTETLAPVSLPVLLRALRRCLTRLPAPPRAYTPQPVITLGVMMHRLIERLGGGHSHFSRLLGSEPSRMEYAIGFIALLSLIRQRVVDATQTGLFEEIEITHLAGGVVADD